MKPTGTTDMAVLKTKRQKSRRERASGRMESRMTFEHDELDAKIAEAVAAEREECAKICDGMGRAAAHINLFGRMSEGYFACATTIRQRG